MLNCHIVRDLLPSYLEHLTSPETEAELTEHLSACPDCRAAKAAMEADLGVEKAPKPRRDFLRHLRWQRRLAALLTLLTAVLCLWGLYQSEYPYDFSPTTVELREVITRELSGTLETEEPTADYYQAEVRVVETQEVENRLFVLYRLEREGKYLGQGYFQFERGPLGRYCWRERCDHGWPLVILQRTIIGGKPYQVVFQAGPAEGASTFRVYLGILRTESGAPLDYQGKTLLCEGSTREPFLAVIPLTEEQAESKYDVYEAAVYFDEDGEEVDLYQLAEEAVGRAHGGGSASGTSPLESLCWYAALILLLAAVILRYFLRK